MNDLPELKISVYSDYVCPFCYLGHHRLLRLRDRYDLKINWCFLEIHPQVSAQGDDIEALDYSHVQWQQMLQNLQKIAAEEQLPLGEIRFITNSHDALLLAEAAKQCGRETFYNLHEKLFRAYFVQAENIGDRAVLRDIAMGCGIGDAIIEAAWADSRYAKRLSHNYHTARQHNIQSVPSFVFGEQVLNGVVPEDRFREAAATLTAA